ncbi:MAG TPA: uroporphyrinogen-III synthase [Hyphomicrobium sp.]|jgi:uroporphyrinogen-III synthase|uniref:uroporphyrinogen-III synthase n=1 Tax=Hyphomicrobium sp. TaxID=82 RepID=UPI002C61302C|nr:uroporphyrinogen-III synthase [Hyphomicrobium sp.]HXE00745.1 uroporphyrinogen-III synthase [Hyphomicrobium sp.]
MHVLITRPEGDGEALKAQIEQLGCRATLAPLISIVSEAIPLSAIAGATALIVTSRNALKALAASPALGAAMALPLYAVGPGTAALARDLGFKDIREGPGTGAELVPILSADGRRTGGTFVHLAGNVLAFDLKTALEGEGVTVKTVTAYRAVAAENLSPAVTEALQNQTIDAVILMSPRTAEAWARIAGEVLTPAVLSGMNHLCLSEAVAGVLRAQLAAGNISVAAGPNLEEMLALVKRLAAHSDEV